MFEPCQGRVEPGIKRLIQELPLPEWIQRSVRSGGSPEWSYFQCRGRDDELVSGLISRARREGITNLLSGTLELANEIERSPVVGVGDLHACDLHDLLDDLFRAEIIDSSGKMHPSFFGLLIQIGDTVDRGPSLDGVYRLFAALQDEEPSKIRRLLGNHELAHLLGHEVAIGAASLPRFRSTLFDDVLSGRVVAAAFEGDTLYTHAGVDVDLLPEFRAMTARQVADELNYRLQSAVLSDSFSDTIFDGRRGIFWKRDDVGASLSEAPFRQVVGHTPQSQGIQALPGLWVKYIDAGRVFAELGCRGFDPQWGREFMVNTEVQGGKGWGRI